MRHASMTIDQLGKIEMTYLENLQYYCWWFSNPSNQLRLVVYPFISQVFFYIQTAVVWGFLNHHFLSLLSFFHGNKICQKSFLMTLRHENRLQRFKNNSHWQNMDLAIFLPQIMLIIKRKYDEIQSFYQIWQIVGWQTFRNLMNQNTTSQ